MGSLESAQPLYTFEPKNNCDPANVVRVAPLLHKCTTKVGTPARYVQSSHLPTSEKQKKKNQGAENVTSLREVPTCHGGQHLKTTNLQSPCPRSTSAAQNAAKKLEPLQSSYNPIFQHQKSKAKGVKCKIARGRFQISRLFSWKTTHQNCQLTFSSHHHFNDIVDTLLQT